MESHEAKHLFDVCPVFPQFLHCKSDLLPKLFLPPLPLKFLLPLPLLLLSPLGRSLPGRVAPSLDAIDCIFTTVSVIYNNELDMTKRYRKNNNLAGLLSLPRWITISTSSFKNDTMTEKILQPTVNNYLNSSQISKSKLYAVNMMGRIYFHVECGHNFSLQVDVCSSLLSSTRSSQFINRQQPCSYKSRVIQPHYS